LVNISRITRLTASSNNPSGTSSSVFWYTSSRSGSIGFSTDVHYACGTLDGRQGRQVQASIVHACPPASNKNH